MAKEKKEEMVEEKKTEAKEAAPRFTLEQMAPHCEDLFDISKCGFVGATYGLDGEYSIDEMNEIIKKWKKQEVK